MPVMTIRSLFIRDRGKREKQAKHCIDGVPFGRRNSYLYPTR
jgi:hypothetical protein